MPKFEVEKFAFEDEPTPDGLGVFVHQKNLFHLPKHPSQPISARPYLYLVPEEEIAIHYAKTKFSPAQPVLLAAKIQNLKLADLRNRENVKIFLIGFRDHLEKELEVEKLSWLREIAVKTELEEIRFCQTSESRLGDLIAGGDFKKYCEFLGYDGLVASEIGKRMAPDRHDIYLIFDPTKARIIEEKILSS